MTVEYFYSIITLLVLLYGGYKFIRWMMKAGSANNKTEQHLTPNDLKVLEESAARLMNDLKATADECVAKIDQACLEAERRLLILSKSVNSESENTSSTSPITTINKPLQNYSSTTGEIELINNLKTINKTQTPHSR